MTGSEKKVGEVTIKSYNPILQFEDVKKIWNDMLAKCPHSFFMSWGWKEVWLKSLPNDCNLSLMVGFNNKKPVFACFIDSQKIFRRGVFRSHQISINKSLDKSIDVLSIEYNSILVDPEIELSLETIIKRMPIKSWDEFYFPYIASSNFPIFELNFNFLEYYNILRQTTSSYYVDLKKVREADMDYLSLLSKSRRKKIRRSIKEYEKLGEVQFHVAQTLDDALVMFDELKKLHQMTWVNRGKPGAFSSDYFYKFHRDLIASRFKNNEIQLLHVTCGQDTIGINYNFVYNRNVFCYQGGYNYLPGGHYLPGMMCDYFSTIYYASKGLDTYDFLSGDAEYKRSLSTDCNKMQNIFIQKKKIRFAIENQFRQLYRSIKCLTSARSGPFTVRS